MFLIGISLFPGNSIILSTNLNHLHWILVRRSGIACSNECNMQRYFFDFTTRGRFLYDYEGDEFPNPHGAYQYAEAIALDLKHRLSGEWTDWSVEVRDALGRKFLSLPVASVEPTTG